jgi:hypothetical protein
VCNPCPQRIETTAVKSCSFIFIDGNENDFSHCFIRFVLKRIVGTDYCVSSAKASGTNPRDLVPLAEKYPGWNPYNYTMQNPINMIELGATGSDAWIDFVEDTNK